jgi:hypothetical protein
MVAYLALGAGAAFGEPGPGVSWYDGFHRGVGYCFRHAGEVVSLREWDEVHSPGKFTQEVVIDWGAAQVFVMVFELGDRDGWWWLTEVMGFLFDPGLEVETEISAEGYEYYRIHHPAGPGAYEQTEVLLPADGAAFRLTCHRCKELGLEEAFSDLVDSFQSRRSVGGSSE